MGGARAIAEAYGFGVSEGPHGEPWTAAYHRAAVHVYAESLPVPYERRIGSLFIHSTEAMDAVDLPAGLVEDWFIVKSYMRNASTAIADWLVTQRINSPEARKIPSPEIDDEGPPRVIHYDRLAALTTLDGARRLERAAIAVQCHIGAPPVFPSPTWLPIWDIRSERSTGRSTGCIERSASWTVYRPCARPPLRACSTADRTKFERRSAPPRRAATQAGPNRQASPVLPAR